MLKGSALQPAIVIAWLENYGHAIVHLRGEVVRVRGDDSEGEKPLGCLGILPRIPESGEGKGLAVVEGVEERLACLGIDLLPLVEAVCGHEAAALLKGNAPHWALLNCLRLDVDVAEAFDVGQ